MQRVYTAVKNCRGRLRYHEGEGSEKVTLELVVCLRCFKLHRLEPTGANRL